MLFEPSYIEKKIKEAFQDAVVEVNDMTGTRDHYQVLVISKLFEGKSTIERHRMVYNVFGQDVGGAIHALSIKTQTP